MDDSLGLMLGRFPWGEDDMKARISKAVREYWQSREGQASRQRRTGTKDAGTRGEVTGGQHLNAFRDLIADLVGEAGFGRHEVRFRAGVELPGYYRPTKKWDLVVVRDGRLCAAIELKSQVGSIGNNFNNRTEEALGNSTDLWRAYEKELLGAHQPWLGYFFFLQDSEDTTKPVRLAASAFAVDQIFERTSYAQRYEILCRRMMLDRRYTAAALLTSRRGSRGTYAEPNSQLSVERFLRSLFGHLIGCR